MPLRARLAFIVGADVVPWAGSARDLLRVARFRARCHGRVPSSDNELRSPGVTAWPMMSR
jgi:hypothetical protein